MTLVSLTLIALVGKALADNRDKADALFKQGKKLMTEKRYADACAAFEQSFKLDPGIGAELNIAKCFEEWGKLGRAYRAYQKAEDMAKEAHDPRVPKIHELVDGLQPQVPQLTIRLPANADIDNLTVMLDGDALDKSELGQPQLVDPGPHQIDWKISGEKKRNKVVPVERGGSLDVKLDVPEKKVAPATNPEKLPPKPQKPEKPEQPVATATVADPGRTRRYEAYGLAGAGVLAIGVSTIVAVSAHSKYGNALKNDCHNATDDCNAAGLSATHDARHEANIATVVFIIGAAAVGGGAALYLTAPQSRNLNEHALYIVPTLSPTAAGVSVGGGF